MVHKVIQRLDDGLPFRFKIMQLFSKILGYQKNIFQNYKIFENKLQRSCQYEINSILTFGCLFIFFNSSTSYPALRDKYGKKDL